MTVALSPDRTIKGISKELLSTSESPNYIEARQQFIQLLATQNLDQQVSIQPGLVSDFEGALVAAVATAYVEDIVANDAQAAYLFLQRILYHLNRLNLFWYDNLQHYKNERSYYLQQVRDRIEEVWQAWKLAQINVEQWQQLDAKQALVERGEADLNPPLSENKLYFVQQAEQFS